jgi:hypothetical protein
MLKIKEKPEKRCNLVQLLLGVKYGDLLVPQQGSNA